jgi:hypothetical protein
MSSAPPPVPPPPPGNRLQPEVDIEYRPSPPHLEEPLLAPRPHKLTPDLPAEVSLFTSHPCKYLFLKNALSLRSFWPRWHAPLTAKYPVASQLLYPHQLASTVLHPLLSPLAWSIPHPVSLCLRCPRVLHHSPLQQGLLGLPGMPPSPVHHPQFRPTFPWPISLLFISLSRLVDLPYIHGVAPVLLSLQIPLHLPWLPCPFQIHLGRTVPSQTVPLLSQPLYPP